MFWQIFNEALLVIGIILVISFLIIRLQNFKSKK